MTAAQTAQRLGLDEKAVAAFSGTGAEFAQHFAVSLDEGNAAIADQATVAGPPTGVTATATDTVTVSIALTPPADNGGSPITGYEITSSPALTLTYDGADTTSPIAVSGVYVQGQAYTFTVKTKNAKGTSAASAATAAVTPHP